MSSRAPRREGAGRGPGQVRARAGDEQWTDEQTAGTGGRCTDKSINCEFTNSVTPPILTAHRGGQMQSGVTGHNSDMRDYHEWI